MNIVYWSTFSKRINSTKQPTGSGTTVDVKLKTPTDVLAPVFISATIPDTANYIQAFGRYYFAKCRYVTNDIKEFTCQFDVLATYKSDIQASTFFVSYSANSADTWLPDTRVPIKSDTIQGISTAVAPFITLNNGFYVLTVNGKSGCVAYVCLLGQLQQLIDAIDNWRTTTISDILSGQSAGVQYDWSTVETGLESIGTMLTQSDVVGNAYANAPNCIRSCIYVPLDRDVFSTGSAEHVYLGEFDTGVLAFRCITHPVASTMQSISIPWHFSDWRRATCESVSVYLPFVGCIQLPANELTGVDALTVRSTVSAVDGSISYGIFADSTLVGSYGASLAVNYPIGINQQASAGQILQSIIQGAEKVASVGVQSTLSPLSMASTAATGVIAGISAGYDVVNVSKQTYPSVIGSFGGGTGIGLGNYIRVSTICHNPVIAPADMAATMGRPAMKPLSLANLTGYCQCANASIDIPGTDTEKNAINSFLNSGFFIE